MSCKELLHNPKLKCITYHSVSCSEKRDFAEVAVGGEKSYTADDRLSSFRSAPEFQQKRGREIKKRLNLSPSKLGGYR
jgi:hypothetical protein